MRRSLFSSILALLLCDASCGDGDKKDLESQSEAKPNEVNSAPAPEKKSVAPSAHGSTSPADNSSASEEPSAQTKETQEEAPSHGTPDDGKLDSLKNSYPKKK